MPTRREEFQIELEALMGSREVYFQAPPNLAMTYPAIVYNLDRITDEFADDARYLSRRGYFVTLMTDDPDDEMVDKLLKFQNSSFLRRAVKDNLNMYYFLIYY